MKKWKEYCKSIGGYYEWIEGDGLDNLAVISYNASEMSCNKEKFWAYCKNELLNDLSQPDKTSQHNSNTWAILPYLPR